MLIDSSQVTVASYRYDPYGNTISYSGPLAEDNLYRFSSKMYHWTSATYYYGYRWYAPFLHRWLNRDPLEELGGINLYGFVANNPLNAFDPWGNEEKEKPTFWEKCWKVIEPVWIAIESRTPDIELKVPRCSQPFFTF